MNTIHTIQSAYQKAENDKVQCLLCPHNCKLSEGQSGICKTRKNSEGLIYALNYGNLCSMSIDPVEKKPLYHFYPGEKIFSVATGGCNFRCLNCQNWLISQSSPESLTNYEIKPSQLIEQVSKQNCRMIAFTYTEPTIFFEYMLDTARIAKDLGIKTVLISNGYINQEPLLELIPYLDAANIDLKCFNDQTYKTLTGGRLEPVLQTLSCLKSKGIWLEITNLIIPELTDNLDMITEMCSWLKENEFENTPLHFSRFFPHYKLNNLPPTPVEKLIEAKRIAWKTGLNYIYIGNISQPQNENTICPFCQKVIVERDAYRLISIHIVHNRCAYCHNYIPGIWQQAIIQKKQ